VQFTPGTVHELDQSVESDLTTCGSEKGSGYRR